GSPANNIHASCESLKEPKLTSNLNQFNLLVFGLGIQWIGFLFQFEVNQHPVAEVMSVLLKSGQSASREGAAEKRNICRSMQNSRHRSIWMPECGPSIFYDQFRPRSHHILPIYPLKTKNPILLFSKPLLMAMLLTIMERESLGLE
ncbi:hypothetical protein IGI04_003006, partial [Brassica rapa subsp. trilocularis]